MGAYNYEKSKKYDKDIIIAKLMAMILGQPKNNAENENKMKETVGN
jgi:hypothetical protein